MKLQASSQQNNRDNSRYNYRNPQERRTFTIIGRPYEDVLEELVDRKLLTLIENWKPPPIKGPHWDDNAYCKYHQSKTSHTMENFQRLKHDIQNLIDNGKLIIDGVSHATNNDHQAYKDPFPKYEKGESSKIEKA